MRERTPSQQPPSSSQSNRTRPSQPSQLQPHSSNPHPHPHPQSHPHPQPQSSNPQHQRQQSHQPQQKPSFKPQSQLQSQSQIHKPTNLNYTVLQKSDRLAKTISTLKMSTSIVNTFQHLISQSKIIHIDSQKKYIVVQKAYLNDLVHKLNDKRSTVQNLKTILHQRNLEIAFLRAECANFGNVIKDFQDKQKGKQQRHKEQMKKLKEKIIMYEKDRDKSIKDIDKLNQILTKRQSQAHNNNNPKLRLTSPKYKSDICTQTQYHTKSQNPVHFHISTPLQTINIDPSPECHKNCLSNYKQIHQKFINILIQLTQTLKIKSQQIQKYQIQYMKFQPLNNYLKKINQQLLKKMQEMQQKVKEQRRKMWKQAVQGVIQRVEKQWNQDYYERQQYIRNNQQQKRNNQQYVRNNNYNDKDREDSRFQYDKNNENHDEQEN